MEKRGEYSRGLTFVILFAFILILGAIAILSNPTTSGFVSKNSKEKGIISEQKYCSGTCQVGYLIEKTSQVKRVSCTFNKKQTPECFCEIPKIPSYAKIIGSPACNVQYSD